MDDDGLRLSIRDCHRCELNVDNNCVPFTGTVPASIVVMGDNPGKVEVEKDDLFVGPAGELLRKHFDTAGIDLSAVAWMNVLSCYTPDTPTKEQVASCKPVRLAQLDLLEPEWVILLGESALQSIRPDLKIAHSRGFVFLHDDFPGVKFFPVYHPAYALRQKLGEKCLAEDLATFVKLFHEDPIPMEAVNDHCGRCGISATYWEPTMVGWGNCGSGSCGLPASSRSKLVEIFTETDDLNCRKTGCSVPADRHLVSFALGEAPEQMTWDSLTNEQQVLAQMVFTGGNKGITIDAMKAHFKKKKKSEVALESDLQRLDALGWVLPPGEYRPDTWTLSPRGRSAMES